MNSTCIQFEEITLSKCHVIKKINISFELLPVMMIYRLYLQIFKVKARLDTIGANCQFVPLH